MSRSLFFISVLFCSLGCFPNTSFGTISYGEAVYISSQQSILIQRMTKMLLLEQKSSKPLTTKKEFDLGYAKFETNLYTLKNNSEGTTTKIKFSLRQVHKKWNLYKQLQHSKSSPLKILDYTQQIIQECELLTKNIEKASILFTEDQNALILKKDQEVTIEIASRQSMLSQQLAVYFLACELRPNMKYLCQEIEQIRTQQKNDLESLIFNSLNNDEIEDNFSIVTALFENLDFYVADNFNKSLSYHKIVQFSNEISNVYNKITEQYLDLYGSITMFSYVTKHQIQIPR